MLGAVTALGPASMDIYLPALPSISDDLSASASVTQLTLAAFVLGLALGQLIAGPMSDVHGRRRPLVVAGAAYIVASALCAVAPGIELLIAGRLLQGLAAAAGIVIGRAVVRDLYAGAGGARHLSRLMLIVAVAPAIAPIVGSAVLAGSSWRGIFVVLVGAGAALLVAIALKLPETLVPEERLDGGMRDALDAFRTLFGDRLFLAHAAVLGFGTAALIGDIAGAPYVIQDVFGRSPEFLSLLFAVNVVALMVTTQVNAHLVGKVGTSRLSAFGIGLLVTAGLLLTVAVVAELGVWVVAVGLLLTLASWGFVASNVIASAMADHPGIAGAAAAVLGLFQFGIAALAAPLAGVAGRESALPMALLVLLGGLLAAAATVAMIATKRGRARAVAVVEVAG